MQQPVLEAAQACDIEKLRALVTDINAPLSVDGHPLLHTLLWDTRAGDISSEQLVNTFSTLREMGVDANALDADGKSPLYIALGEEFEDVTRQLVTELGADPNLPVVRDQCIECAMEENDDFSFNLLLDLGCRMPHDGRYTALLFFYGEKDAEYYAHMLERLMDLGLIDANERDGDMDTPLHCAMMSLELKIDVFARKSVSDHLEEQLQLAHQLATILLQRGANPLLVNNEGKTPLDICSQRFNKAIIEGDTNDVEELLTNAMADALDRTDEEKFRAFKRSRAGEFLGEHICTVLILPLAVIPHPRGLISQRRERIVAMLGTEGITADGCYFEDCLRGIRPISMREFRLRHYISTAGAREYELIVRRLKRSNGGRYYSGIHAEARSEIKERLAQRGIGFDLPIVAEGTTGDDQWSSLEESESMEEDESDDDESEDNGYW